MSFDWHGFTSLRRADLQRVEQEVQPCKATSAIMETGKKKYSDRQLLSSLALLRLEKDYLDAAKHVVVQRISFSHNLVYLVAEN